jgi:inner membrane protein
MGRALWLKIGVIVLIAIALLVPLAMISGKIDERDATRAGVVRELAASSVGEQTVSGPLLLLPCTDRYVVQEGNSKDGYKNVEKSRDCTRAYTPQSLSVTATLTTEERHRGIYSARFFTGAFRFSGRFEVPADTPPGAGVTREWHAPLLLFSLRDARGIRNAPGVTWNGALYAFSSGTGASGNGIRVALPYKAAPFAGSHTFSFPMEIMGLQSLNFVPSAADHQVTISADWPHPSFGGRHLPVTREVTGNGFHAAWRVSALASEAPRALAACRDPACSGLDQHAFGVRLVDPVDVYMQAHRAVKYALLFVLLTFSGFFLFEILRDLRIHPVQYLLVGLALAIFFLLLIALSEHMRFVYAYVIAAAACVTLIAAYLQAVLGSALRALGFAGMLSALYTMLYALLRSEDHSLLMGSILVFGMLAAIMLATRRVDWYRVASLPAKPPAAAVR